MKFASIRTALALCAAAAFSTFAHADLPAASWTKIGTSANVFTSLIDDKAGTKLSFAMVGEETFWASSQTFGITDGNKTVAIFAGSDTTGATKVYTVGSMLSGVSFDSHSGSATQMAPGGSAADFYIYQSKTNSNLYGFSYEDWLRDSGSIDHNDMVVTMTVTPVPEPETYALMLGGLGVLGLLARRRRAV